MLSMKNKDRAAPVQLTWITRLLEINDQPEKTEQKRARRKVSE